ncbi:hypothetical protein [Parabacteroides provencensis]|uniref:hypothetical protein n=1 Tax=Parabacteroides provencensis TaxID=1944636 RepID=UPI000C14699B|nr:hypothetical protein [Parabacteroides provencensis]
MNKTSYYLLLFSFIFCMGSCDKEDLILISPGGNEKVIEVKMYDVGLKFYLQNEQGEPSTTFKNGENFDICCSIENFRETEFLMYDHFPPDEIGKVYKSDGTFVGVADGFPINWVDIPSIYYPGRSNIGVFPWIRDDINEQHPLPPGNYYIGFTFRFDLSNTKDEYYKNAITDEMKFRIYFTVE